MLIYEYGRFSFYKTLKKTFQTELAQRVYLSSSTPSRLYFGRGRTILKILKNRMKIKISAHFSGKILAGRSPTYTHY